MGRVCPCQRKVYGEKGEQERKWPLIEEMEQREKGKKRGKRENTKENELDIDAFFGSSTLTPE
jgi:hypothetical protein